MGKAAQFYLSEVIDLSEIVQCGIPHRTISPKATSLLFKIIYGKIQQTNNKIYYRLP